MENDKNSVIISGIHISTLNKSHVLDEIKGYLGGQAGHQIVTPNPEFIIEAEKDEEFFHILNNASLAVSDGIGLIFAGWLSRIKLTRFSGVDLVYEICRIAEKEKKSVYFVGGEGETARQASENLKKQFPGLIIAGAEAGLQPDEWKIERGEWLKGKEKNDELIKKINEKKPDIIFAAFGHPKQDKWIYHNLPDMPSVKIGMGVGGSFDFIAGRVKRAPKLMRALGLEWLWRLILEPWRWKRIINAVIIFPVKFFQWKFILPYFYRPSVVCLLYKKENDKYRILIVKRGGQPNVHWQLPQGGTDGEDLMTAGKREIEEELGTDKLEVKVIYKNLYKYLFDERNGKYKILRHLGYKGQKQGLLIAEFTGDDSDIKINFWDHEEWMWVDKDDLVETLHEVRKGSAEIFLGKFKEFILSL